MCRQFRQHIIAAVAEYRIVQEAGCAQHLLVAQQTGAEFRRGDRGIGKVDHQHQVIAAELVDQGGNAGIDAHHRHHRVVRRGIEETSLQQVARIHREHAVCSRTALQARNVGRSLGIGKIDVLRTRAIVLLDAGEHAAPGIGTTVLGEFEAPGV